VHFLIRLYDIDNLKLLLYNKSTYKPNPMSENDKNNRFEEVPGEELGLEIRKSNSGDLGPGVFGNELIGVDKNKERDFEDEKRDLTPEQVQKRALFEKIAKYVERYSTLPETWSEERIKRHIKAEIQELKASDPYVPLLIALNSKEWDLAEKKNVKIGTYKLKWPKVSDLNDIYLGYTDTNKFIDELHGEMRKVFGEGTEVLREFHKGGYFLADFDKEKNGKRGMSLISNKEDEFREVVAKTLEKHLKNKKEYYEYKIPKLQKEVDLFSSVSLDKEASKKLKDIREELLMAEKKLPKIEALLNEEFQEGAQPVEIAFGFSESLKKDMSPKKRYLEIMFSEWQGNSTAARKYMHDETFREEEEEVDNGQNNQDNIVEAKKDESPERLRSISQQFDLNYLVLDAARVLFDAEKKIDENGEIKKEWQDFFWVDDSGEVLMTEKAIMIHRKTEKFHNSEEYKNMSEEERCVFDKNLDEFGIYYEGQNTFDSLKGFQVKKFKHYHGQIKKRVALVSGAKDIEEEKDPKKLVEIWKGLSTENEILIKDEGEKICGTLRSNIKALLKADGNASGDGNSALLFADYVEFGGINQGALEEDVRNVIYAVVPKEELRALKKENGDLDVDRAKGAISDNLKKLEGNEVFEDLLMSIGDFGTKVLRGNDGILNKAYKNEGGEIDSSGGDETFVALTENVSDDLGVHSKKALEVADKANLRMAISIHKNPVLLPIEDVKSITSEARGKIMNVVDATLWGEESHEKIKGRGNENPVEIRKIA